MSVELFTDTTDIKSPNTEVGLKILFEEMKDLKDSMKAELKELRSVMKKFETTPPFSVGKEVIDIHCGRSFRICKVEKFEDLTLRIVEEICKTDTRTKPRKSILIGNEWQSPLSGIRLTVKIKECKDKSARRDQFHAVINHMESPQCLRRFSHELERVLSLLLAQEWRQPLGSKLLHIQSPG